MHKISPRFRANQIGKESMVIGHDWYQISMKKIEKSWHENQILIPSLQRFFGPKTQP